MKKFIGTLLISIVGFSIYGSMFYDAYTNYDMTLWEAMVAPLLLVLVALVAALMVFVGAVLIFNITLDEIKEMFGL